LSLTGEFSFEKKPILFAGENIFEFWANKLSVAYVFCVRLLTYETTFLFTLWTFGSMASTFWIDIS
jgi:hypothetical protein